MLKLKNTFIMFVTVLLLACSTMSVVDSNAAPTAAPVVSVAKPYDDYIIKITNKEQYEKQRNCLALNIYHEARGENIEGQLAVAQVTLNRVKDPNFPDSICQVVYERTNKVCQFSWVCVKKSQYPTNREQYAQIKKLADSILRGEKKHARIEYRNAVYYHADWVSPNWMAEKKEVARIGRHIFYAEDIPLKSA